MSRIPGRYPSLMVPQRDAGQWGLCLRVRGYHEAAHVVRRSRSRRVARPLFLRSAGTSGGRTVVNYSDEDLTKRSLQTLRRPTRTSS